jgi:hypothetical protein
METRVRAAVGGGETGQREGQRAERQDDRSGHGVLDCNISSARALTHNVPYTRAQHSQDSRSIASRQQQVQRHR